MKELQNGRSMIEMLGVLAIIGVLSIGGLAGYTMAMNRYRANQISDYASRCVVVSQTNGLSGVATAGACSDILKGESAPAGYSAKILATPTADETKVQISNITPAVVDVLTAKFDSKNVNGVCWDGTDTFTFSQTCS